MATPNTRTILVCVALTVGVVLFAATAQSQDVSFKAARAFAVENRPVFVRNKVFHRRFLFANPRQCGEHGFAQRLEVRR